MKKLSYVVLGGVLAVGVGAYLYMKSKGKNILGALPKQTGSATSGQPPLASNIGSTPPNTIPSTSVPSTAVNTGSSGSGNSIPVINPVDGTLSGSTGGSQTPQVNQQYLINLNKANIAFEELKVLQKQKADGVSGIKIGSCKTYGGFYGSCQATWTDSDVSAIINSYYKKIVAKEKEIFALGFKVVGDKLFAI